MMEYWNDGMVEWWEAPRNGERTDEGEAGFCSTCFKLFRVMAPGSGGSTSRVTPRIFEVRRQAVSRATPLLRDFHESGAALRFVLPAA
jgi:hypothetical protein